MPRYPPSYATPIPSHLLATNAAQRSLLTQKLRSSVNAPRCIDKRRIAEFMLASTQTVARADWQFADDDECDAIAGTTSKALIGRFLGPRMGHSFAGVTVHRPLADVSGLSESAAPDSFRHYVHHFGIQRETNLKLGSRFLLCDLEGPK